MTPGTVLVKPIIRDLTADDVNWSALEPKMVKLGREKFPKRRHWLKRELVVAASVSDFHGNFQLWAQGAL